MSGADTRTGAGERESNHMISMNGRMAFKPSASVDWSLLPHLPAYCSHGPAAAGDAFISARRELGTQDTDL
jgi:hypothetical protein